MRPRPYIRLTLAFALLPIAARAEALKRPAVEKANAEITSAVKMGSAEKITQWFERYTTPNYAQVNEKGKRTDRKSALAGTIRLGQLSGGKITRIASRVTALKGDARQVHSMEQWTYEITQRDNKGKDHQLVLTDSEDNLWVPTASGWKIKASKILATKALMDGKPARIGGSASQ